MRSGFGLCISFLLMQNAGISQVLPTGTDAAQRMLVPAAAFAPAAATGPRSSPFNPPDANDKTFVTDAAPKLDTGCIFRSSGPIVFNIEITRYVGEINPDGTLKNAAALVSAGLLSSKATLIMPAFDVDSDAVVSPPFQPERDRFSFNGQEIGFLTGANNVWKLNSFEVPIEKLHFPNRAAAGSSPTPALNEIRIDIDVANAPLGEELWCTAIDWGALSFKTISPVILVHGNTSDGGFFDRQGFTGELRLNNIPYDNSITMATNTIAVHAQQLDTLIPAVVKSFGVDSAHLVVHSKGGLDSRDYLSTYQAKHEKDFTILSFSSLSTPHNGSVGADVLVERDRAAAVANKIEFVGFPDYTRELAALMGVDLGTTNLTTSFVAAFNAKNIPKLPAGTVFNTTAADADTNNNGEIDNTPDEYAQLRAENLGLRVMYTVNKSLARYVIDAIYQILRNTASVKVAYSTETVIVGNGVPATITVATITSVPTTTAVSNDTLVTIPSGQGAGSLASRVSNTATFTGAAGRNHSSIADAGVAATVIGWIIGIEKSRGDLK